MAEDRIITKAELDKHSYEDDYWVAVNGKVYDMTNFMHPGGPWSKLSLSPFLSVVTTNTYLRDPKTRRPRCLRIIQRKTQGQPHRRRHPRRDRRPTPSRRPGSPSTTSSKETSRENCTQKSWQAHQNCTKAQGNREAKSFPKTKTSSQAESRC